MMQNLTDKKYWSFSLINTAPVRQFKLPAQNTYTIHRQGSGYSNPRIQPGAVKTLYTIQGSLSLPTKLKTK